MFSLLWSLVCGFYMLGKLFFCWQITPKMIFLTSSEFCAHSITFEPSMHFSVPSHSLPIQVLNTPSQLGQTSGRNTSILQRQKHNESMQWIVVWRLQTILVRWPNYDSVSPSKAVSTELDITNSWIDIQMLIRDEWDFVTITPGWFQVWNFNSI